MPKADVNPASASVATTGKGIKYIGGSTWAGWSGTISATNGSDATLFDFTSPSAGLKITASFFFDENNLGANELLGLTMKLNGSTVYKMRIKKSGDAGFTNLDSDNIGLIIPPFTEVLITATTSDADNIQTGVNLVCKEV